MIDYEFVTVVVFRVINLGVLGGCAYYVYRHYVRDGFISQMHDEEQKISDANLECKRLKSEDKRVEKDIRQDADQQDHLKHQLFEWKKVVGEEQGRLDQEQANFVERFKREMKVQADAIRNERLARKTLPKIVAQAKAELKEKFESPKKQEEYVNHILSVIKKV